MGDLVCVGSCSGTFYALDRHDGRLRWSHDVRPGGRPTSFHGDPLVAGNLVVIGTDQGTQADHHNAVWAFASPDGAVRWRHALEDGIVSDIIADGTRAFAFTRRDSLLCLDLATGRRLWSYADSGVVDPQFVYRSPCVARGRVFLADEGGRIRALEGSSGRTLWTRQLGAAITTGALAIGDEITVADVRGSVDRLEQETGEPRGSVSVGAVFQGPPVAIGDSLVVLAGDAAIACIDRRANRLLWKLELRLGTSRPYVWHGAVIAATVGGELLALDPHDGTRLWTRTVTGIVRGIGQDEDTLYLGEQKGMLTAFRPPAPEQVPPH